MPTTTHTFDAMYVISLLAPLTEGLETMYSLFDMDGTLIDSTAGVVGAWEEFAKQYPEIDVKDILSSA